MAPPEPDKPFPELPIVAAGRWIVLVGGGVDSAVLLGLLHRAEVEFALMHLDYGQKTRARERACADALARHYGKPPPVVFGIPLLGHLSGHAMLDGGARLDTHEPKRAYVPFRNTLLLGHAAAWAEHHGYDHLAIGSHASDRICPDNTPPYMEAFQALLDVARLATSPIRVQAPFVRLTKARVVEIGHALEVPFEATWSCYNDTDDACGSCGNCRDRSTAFAEAGIGDPIRYRVGT